MRLCFAFGLQCLCFMLLCALYVFMVDGVLFVLGVVCAYVVFVWCCVVMGCDVWCGVAVR